MVLPVPADGVIPIHIQLSDKVATLTVDVSGHFKMTVSKSLPTSNNVQYRSLYWTVPGLGTAVRGQNKDMIICDNIF